MRFTTLVSTEQLAQQLDDPNWIVFDCRFTLTNTEAGRSAYRQGHIPGARYVHLDEDMSSAITPASGRHPLPEVQVFADKLSRWGVDSRKQVVVYDDSFGSMAVKMWWLLRWLGHDNVALLNGNWQLWVKHKLPVTTELSKIIPAHFEPHVRSELLVDTEEVDFARRERCSVLIDARSEQRFSGEQEPLDKVAGHIPGALNWVYEENLDFDGTYLPADELKEAYINLMHGLKPQQVIHTCGSGVTACHNMLAMEIAGLHGSKLYAGSWSEWITDPKRPVATGEGHEHSVHLTNDLLGCA